MKITDEEVWEIIFDGAIQLCDSAIEKWQSGKYTPYPLTDENEKMQKDNMARWTLIKKRIREIKADRSNR